MERIIKIWFEDETLCGLGDDGVTYRQSLVWYPRLKKAADEDRAKYEISTIGIHWPELDEDVSFESILYDDTDPSVKTPRG